MNRFVLLALCACGGGSTTTAPKPTTQPTTVEPVKVDEAAQKAQIVEAHRKLEEEQQDALAATCTEPGKPAPRCLPGCYPNETLDSRATKRPQNAIAIEHLACEKQGGDGSGPFTLADETGKLTAKPARAGKPHKKGSWQANVETALAPLLRPKRTDVVVVTGAAWKDLEHPVTKEKLRCVTVAHYAKGIKAIDGCGSDGSLGCEAMGDPAAHGINVVHFRLAEAKRLQAANKQTDCQQAALEAIAVARGLPRWRQYMQLNVAKWARHAAYRTRFDGVLDEDSLFTTAIALGKEAEEVYAACGGAKATTTATQEQSFHTCW